MLIKLRNKFVVINMSLVSLVLLIVFFSLYFSNSIKFKDNNNKFLRDILNRPMSHMDTKKGPRDHGDIQLYAFSVILDYDFNVVKVINHMGNIDNTIVKQAISSINLTKSTSGVIDDLSLRYLSKKINSGYTVAFMDISRDKAYLAQLIKFSLIIAVGALSAFYIISLYLAKYALKPVEKAWKNQQQFVADASHELKTPLTVILTTISILLNSKDTLTSNQEKWISYIDEEAIRMQKLVEDLLFLARSDESQHDIINIPVNLNDCVENCILLFEPVAFEAELNLENHISGNNTVLGNPDLLKQLIMILIDNAIKYSKENGKISVVLESMADKAILSVNNKGVPINKKEIPHLFDRFYRGDKSRNRNARSYGLGLSIAKEIVNVHKGKISVESTLKSGTTFSIQFPLTTQ